MKTKKRLKLCLNCNGQVDVDVIVCPFCGADLMEERSVKENPAPYDISHGTLNTEKTIASLYPPPYQPNAFGGSAIEEQKSVIHDSQQPSQEATESEAKTEIASTLLSILLFSFGVNFFLLGPVLFFFSEEGSLFLRFNGNLWFIYFFVSIPLLYFGFKKLSKID